MTVAEFVVAAVQLVIAFGAIYVALSILAHLLALAIEGKGE